MQTKWLINRINARAGVGREQISAVCVFTALSGLQSSLDSLNGRPTAARKQ